MEKSLVVYYSKSGNTRRVANMIKDMIDADIYEVKTKKENSSDIGDMLRLYVDPLLPLQKVSENYSINIKEYDHIYIGTPVWGLTYSLPIKELLKENDFSGKRISLFCTHDGGVGSTLSSMAKKTGNAEIVKTIEIISSNCRNESILSRLLHDWIKE